MMQLSEYNQAVLKTRMDAVTDEIVSWIGRNRTEVFKTNIFYQVDLGPYHIAWSVHDVDNVGVRVDDVGVREIQAWWYYPLQNIKLELTTYFTAEQTERILAAVNEAVEHREMQKQAEEANKIGLAITAFLDSFPTYH